MTARCGKAKPGKSLKWVALGFAALAGCGEPTPAPTLPPGRYCAAVRTAVSSGAPRPPSSVFSVVEAGLPPDRGILADVNHDGRLDFVRDEYPTFGEGVVFAVLGRGDGTFSERVDVWERGNSVGAADLNGDGLTDVVVQSGEEIVILYATQNPNRPWKVRRWRPGVRVYDFQFGDINGDGWLDIVASTLWEAPDAIYMLLSTEGGFNLQGAFPRPTWDLPGRNGTVLADFTGDRVPDLLTNEGAFVRVFAARHCGGFDHSPLASPLGDFRNPLSLKPGDFNGDGFLDLLLGYVVPEPAFAPPEDKKREIGILLNRGDGTFAAERRFPLDPPIGSSPTPTRPPTWVAPTFTISSAGVCPCSPTPSPSPTPAATLPPYYPFYPAGVAVADLNNDGALDAITVVGRSSWWGGGSGAEITVSWGDGEGEFCATDYFHVPCMLGQSWLDGSFHVADLNRDGLLDVVGTNCIRGWVLLSRGTPLPEQGGTQQVKTTPTPTPPPPS